ncbi:anti-lipopolysaccharide factor-like [Eriocheir sinensis]|uniref:anti-lipopolysaccharide factor-like n=1 Tax=Eriocheir sinensis TaxID=95602 RepID=UPI0021C6F07C|nr:anti-lipopolysaccharide factor-like [Eriocheir sinensis]
MRVSVLTGLCVAAVVLCLYLPQPCEAQWDMPLVVAVVSKLAKLTRMWYRDSVNFMGHVCHIKRSPTVRKFKLYYKGRFWCPGWTPITGTSLTKGRTSSVREATRSYVYQAFTRGFIHEEAINSGSEAKDAERRN